MWPVYLRVVLEVLAESVEAVVWMRELWWWGEGGRRRWRGTEEGGREGGREIEVMVNKGTCYHSKKKISRHWTIKFNICSVVRSASLMIFTGNIIPLIPYPALEINTWSMTASLQNAQRASGIPVKSPTQPSSPPQKHYTCPGLLAMHCMSSIDLQLPSELPEPSLSKLTFADPTPSWDLGR